MKQNCFKRRSADMFFDSVARYYDFLAKENHDPVYDPEILRTYMDQWDG